MSVAPTIAGFAAEVDCDEALWPRLRRAMAAETAEWPQIAPPDAALAALRLDDVRNLAARPDCAAALEASRILADEEARRLQSFRFPKRRAEWLGGRLAAKAALLELLATDAEPASLVIENDEHGRPTVKQKKAPPQGELPGAAGLRGPPAPDYPHVAITHSGNFAAALAAPRPCGLDVQEIRPNLAKVRDYFADAGEIALGDGEEHTAWLARIWAAKEAIKKCRYPAEPTFMERITITGRAGEILLCRLADTDESLAVQTALHGNYAVALCLDQPEPAAITKDA